MKKLVLCLLSVIFAASVFAQMPEMIEVEGGTFIMGNDYSIDRDEAPEHKVTLSSFMMGKYEVTFDDFDRFCQYTGATGPDDARMGRGKKPVMNISWESAVMYCNWLSKVNRLDKCYTIVVDSLATVITCDFNANGFRLPTEAEWEYAAKGGKNSKGYSFSGSHNLDEVGWYNANSGGYPQDVGKKKANELGLFDMSGNVREWCWDYYAKDYYRNSPDNNPKGPKTGLRRVYRGGAWNLSVDFLRMSARESMAANKDYGNIGFRLVKKVE